MTTAFALELAFAVQIGQVAIGTFSECSGLGAERETYAYPEGGNNLYVHRLPGRLQHPNVTLKGGVTNQTALLDWVLGQGALAGSAGQDVMVAFRTPDGGTLRKFALLQAVPVRWTGPAGNASGNAVATESLEIAHQGVVAA